MATVKIMRGPTLVTGRLCNIFERQPKIATNDFQPSFSMDNLLKDLRLAKSEGEQDRGRCSW
jgi:3-hydroxyisobutyrate dehydrogenase-like beta-hydroxyacid dehydrogenase